MCSHSFCVHSFCTGLGFGAGGDRYVGLWRAEVMEAEIFRPRTAPVEGGPRDWAEASTTRLRLVVGDASGARTQLMIPYTRMCVPT